MKGSQPPSREKKGMPPTVLWDICAANFCARKYILTFIRSSRLMATLQETKVGGSAEVTCSRESMFKINRPQTQNLFFPAVIFILTLFHPPHPAPVCLSPFCFSGQLSPKESPGLPAHRQDLTQANFTLTRCPRAKAVPPASSSLPR